MSAILPAAPANPADSKSLVPLDRRAAYLARYKRLRQVHMRLNGELLEHAEKADIDEAGRALGILRRGVLVFDSEIEMDVLYDYLLHDVRRGGRNAIERRLIESPPHPDSDEMACLRAKQHASYSLFVVEEASRGFGVVVRDLASDERTFVVDIGFGATAQLGLVTASRIYHHDEFANFSGAGLPVGFASNRAEEKRVGKIVDMLRAKRGRLDPAVVIRACLGAGASERIRYQNPDEPLTALSRAPSPATHAPADRPADLAMHVKFNRNAPCPCGSGRKYKKCCLRKREA